MAKKSFVPYMNRYGSSSLPNALAKRKHTAEIIEKAKKKKLIKTPKPKINLDRFAKWETAAAATRETQKRRNVNALLEKYKGHLNSPTAQSSILGLFSQTQKYIESDAYKSKAENLDTYDLVNAPHMNRNYVEALKFQKIYEAGDKAALPRYVKAAYRTLRDKMLPEELEARLDYYQTTNAQILDVMKNVKGFEDESDERKLSEFYRIFNDAKSKMSMEYDSRDVMQAMLSGSLYEFVDEDNEVNPQALNDFIKLNSADAASVSANIKKASQTHIQNPEAKRTSDRFKYLKDPSTKLLDIENLTPEEFKMMTGINKYTPGVMLKMFNLFDTVGELNDAKEVIHTGIVMLGPTDRFMSPYSVESYEIVKALRARFPNASVEELQALWRPRFTGMRDQENLAEVLALKGDD